eukprot:6213835-Pleurochrysis_carterae.AAC.2
MPRLSFARRIADMCDAFRNAQPCFATLKKSVISAWKSAVKSHVLSSGGLTGLGEAARIGCLHFILYGAS